MSGLFGIAVLVSHSGGASERSQGGVSPRLRPGGPQHPSACSSAQAVVRGRPVPASAVAGSPNAASHLPPQAPGAQDPLRPPRSAVPLPRAPPPQNAQAQDASTDRAAAVPKSRFRPDLHRASRAPLFRDELASRGLQRDQKAMQAAPHYTLRDRRFSASTGAAFHCAVFRISTD